MLFRELEGSAVPACDGALTVSVRVGGEKYEGCALGWGLMAGLVGPPEAALIGEPLFVCCATGTRPKSGGFI